MEAFGLAIYAACVDFLLRSAAWLGITYRDANAAMFFLLWPVVTCLLLLLVMGQGCLLWWRGRRRLSKVAATDES